MKTTIQQWSGISDNGIYYTECFGPVKANGKSMMSVKYHNSFVLSEDTAGFTGFNRLNAGVKYKYNGSTVNSLLFSNSKMFLYPTIGLIHTCSETPSWPDIAITKSNNVLFTTQEHLGIGILGQCHADSSTTKIVDSAGRNLETLGLAVAVGSNKAYNLNKKEEYTITSIANENATKDCLVVNAGTANAENDWFIFFAEKKFNFFATTPYPHFKGQPAVSQWKRQIIPFSSGSTRTYFVLNGNWLAGLNTDESTFNDNYKQLPDNTQAHCGAANGGYILIGGEINGSGRLCLWDGYTSSGWQGDIQISNIPTSIVPYKTGWLVIAKHAIYFTDGVNISEYYVWPDCEDDLTTLNTLFNSAIVYNDKLIINASPRGFARNKAGVGIIEPKNGMIFVPFNDGVGTPLYNPDNQYAGAVYFYSEDSLDYIYAGHSEGDGTADHILNRLRIGKSDVFPVSKNGASFILYQPFGGKVNVKKIALSITPKMISNEASSASNSITLKLAVGDGRRPLWNYSQTGTGSSATSIANTSGATYRKRGYVGQEIRMLTGVCAGDRSYITAIADAGTASETWTISPALSAAPANGDWVNIMNLNFQGEKTMQLHNIPEPIEFDVAGIYTENLFIELQFTGANVGAIDVSNLQIFS
jgi:hypothetical protein